MSRTGQIITPIWAQEGDFYCESISATLKSAKDGVKTSRTLRERAADCSTIAGNPLLREKIEGTGWEQI